ncbi:hypothetical protein [Vulcanisaeta sp. JCM 14467]|uniref:hypothetical protein n=1 Tax=Vulcanisaeta sp. JCM 14467 TaxID=1295370 RepID=UPI002092A9A6|nr:hypothetical protein [Vulcanisaeta sp. JCM 14467]
MILLIIALGMVMAILPAYRAPPPNLGGGTWSSYPMTSINPLCGPLLWSPPCWAM